MKLNKLLFALVVLMASFAPPIFAQNVAKVGDTEYTTLSAAITAAQSGQTVTLIDDAAESVTIGKNLTIDGAGKTYTGAMTLKADATIKNVNFDGKGYNGYAVETRGANYLTIEDCTAKNYGYGFVQLASGTALTTVKNVTVSNMNYGVKVDYSNAVVIENSNIDAAVAAVLNSNYGEKTVTIKNSTLNIYGTWTRNNTVKTNVVFEGANSIDKFIIDANIDNFKLAEGATLTAPNEITVTIDNADYDVAYENGTYTVVAKNYVAQVGEAKYETFADAVAAAPAGGTVTLIDDATEAATVILTKNLTIDGSGKTFTGAIEFKKSNGNFTVKNVNFNGADTRVYALKSVASTTSLKVEGCTATGYTYGFLHANKTTTNVTVTDVTVTDVNYGVHSVYGTNVTLNNFVAENVKYGVYVQNYGTRKVVLNNCSFTGSEYPLSIWERNQTNKITFNFQGANEMGKADFCTSAMAVINAEAVAGTKVCGTLAEAVAAAQAGDAVTLLRNVELSAFVTIDKSITLNMGEYNITRNGGTALYVNGDVEVAINGTGTVTGSQALYVANGLVQVNGGNFVGIKEAVYVQNTGKVEIYGGTFEATDVPSSFVLNKKDSDRATTSITVYGGTFTGFNPADNAAEGKGTNFVAPGYMAVANADGTYGIAKAAIKMGDTYYATLAEAIAAIGADDNVIELLADATLDYGAREAYGTAETASVTILGNGHTLTLNQTNSDWSSFGVAAGKVVLNNMTIEKTGHGDTSGAWNKHAIIFSSPVEMNNVTVNNSVAVQAGAALTNVTIHEANGYYGLWINGNGQAVTVNGGAINATNGGRGIKIADQYIDAPVQVTLKVDGTVFNTAKKAAVLVSSKAGAKITASNYNIDNVAEDRVNFVWVDEDWAPYFAEVEVTGAIKTQEGIENFVAKRENGTSYKTLAAAITAAQAGETITLLADATEEATVILTKNLKIDGNGHTFTGAIEFKKANGSFTVKNVKFNGPGNSGSAYALKSQSSTTSLTVENCEATGYPYGFLYANSAIANVTVTNVTVKNVNYGVHSARGTNVTLNDFVAENVKYGVYVQNYSGRNVVLNNCSFTGSEYPLSIWERNQTNKITFNFKGVNEMGKADFCTDAMAVVNADAIVGTKVYATLAEAVEAANAGDAVTLLRNVELSAFVTINKSITLNLGEYNITRNDGTALYVNGDVEVAINGTTGTVTGSQALYVANGLVKVNGGNFRGAYEAVYVQKTGKAEIYGGTFASSETNSYVLNQYDADRATSSITVYGGTFTGFNPADNAAEGAGTNFVAENYVSKDNGDGTYSVEFDPTYGKVAKVGEEYYATLAGAVAVGGEVTLLADINENVTLTKNVTINGAGFKYTGTMSANKNITVTVQNVNFVNAGFSKSDKSTNGNYTFKGCTFDGQGTYSRAIYVRGANKVVLEDCTATGYDYFMYVPNALNNSITVKNVTVENCDGYAVMFNSGAGKAMFEKFTVKNTPTAIIYNNTANRALTLNNCTMENVDTAIKYTAGDKNITCTFVGKNDLGGAAFSEYVVLNNAALAGTVIYSSLAEAVAADGNEVKLLGNSTGAGVVIDEDLTIDFNGKTYTFNGDAVGSSNTKSNGFQILKENKVTLMNGTLKVAEAAKDEFYILVQNYANLTVENMNLDGTNLDKYSATDGDSYVLSNNSGEVVITGNTNITANNDGDKAFAFDACDKSGWGYALPVVKVYTTGVIAGGIENSATIELYSGTYTMDVNEWCAEGYAATKIADNKWTVGKAIAQVGGQTFGSIQAAFDAAQDGDNITLLADVELGWNDIIDVAGYNVLAKVEGKEITFDMNDKTIAVNHQSTTDRIFAVIYVEDGAGLTVTGNGTIDINADDNTPKVAYMFWKRGTTGYLVIENGNFHMDNSEDSMVYTNGDEIVTVKGGTFTLDAIGTRTNGFPWIFNAAGNNERQIIVLGGTYNYDIRKQHWFKEVKLGDGLTMVKDDNNLWKVAEAVAVIDEMGYLTLADAIEAAQNGETVTLLANATGAGVVIDKSIKIDFGGHTYTFNKAVGSTGTETLGFQILKGTEVVLQNGTLTSTDVTEGKEVKVLVQNYADALTLEDMNLVDATEHILYALSNNNGETKLTGNTNITTDAVAFDSYYSKSYAAPTVNVETTGTITGAIEKNDGATIAISSGTFTAEILPEWCAEYYVPVQNEDKTWTVDYRYIDELTIVDVTSLEKFENENEITVGKLTYERQIPQEAIGKWQSLYVPFEIPVQTLKDLGYDVAFFYDVHFDVLGGGEIDPTSAPDVHLIKIHEGTLKANYPYAIRASQTANLSLSLEFENAKLYSTKASEMNWVESGSTINRFIFAGTYIKNNPAGLTNRTDEVSCYVVNKYGNFQKLGSTTRLSPFRVFMYILAKDGSPVLLNETAANSIAIRVIGEKNENGETIIYDVEADNQEGVDYIYDLQGRRVLEPQKGGLYIVNGKKVVF